MYIGRVVFILLLTIIYNEVRSQVNSCNYHDVLCFDYNSVTYAATTNQFAESGPDYGCLNSQPNPNWFFFQIFNPGDVYFNMYSDDYSDIDFICWGPFNRYNGPCTDELKCTVNNGSHTVPGPGNVYPAGVTVDCSYDPTWNEWCNISNALTGEYYILLITNVSNSPCNITLEILPSTTAMSACAMAYCYFITCNYSFSSCNEAANQFSLVGNIIFQTDNCDPFTITDHPSGKSQSIFPPYGPMLYSLDSIPMDGIQHSVELKTIYGDNIYSFTYIAPDSCIPCNVDAGVDFNVCGLDANISATENIGDTNSHWYWNTSFSTGVCFGSQGEPNTSVTVENYGLYHFIWQITNADNFTCADTVDVTFIDPAGCTSIAVNSDKSVLNVFPNPVFDNSLIVEYSSQSQNDIQIKIYNAQGNEVLCKKVRKNIVTVKTSIDVSALISGIYIIELNDGNVLQRKQVIIQKDK